MIDDASGGTFMNKYEDKAIELTEALAKNSTHYYALNQSGRFMRPRKVGIHDLKNVEIGLLIDKVSLLKNKGKKKKIIEPDPQAYMLLLIEHYYFSVDFIIADMKITKKISHALISLGRPCLAIAKATTN
ncbi:unnamed protein product [Spirodela intermedia]|uniref:Uncharacterized protein n=1 Tax=Spirodela intermedia TaxID=51605 RepID=A0ABN7EBU2_SPIIN|nr:unnamed protein product [Spirodela intermedia]